MKENKRNIDEFFLEELGNATEAPPSLVWDNLEKRLDQTKPVGKTWWFYLIVASIFVGGSIAAYYAGNQKTMPKTSEKRKTELEAAAARNATISNSLSNTTQKNENNKPGTSNTANTQQTLNNQNQSQANTNLHSGSNSTASAKGKRNGKKSNNDTRNADNEVYTSKSSAKKSDVNSASAAINSDRNIKKLDNQNAFKANTTSGNQTYDVLSTAGNSKSGKNSRSAKNNTAQNGSNRNASTHKNNSASGKNTETSNANGINQTEDALSTTNNRTAGKNSRSAKNNTAKNSSNLKSSTTAVNNSTGINQVEDTFSTAGNGSAANNLRSTGNNAKANAGKNESIATGNVTSSKNNKENNLNGHSQLAAESGKNNKSTAGIQKRNSSAQTVNNQSRNSDEKSNDESKQSDKGTGTLKNNTAAAAKSSSKINVVSSASQALSTKAQSKISDTNELQKDQSLIAAKPFDNSKNESVERVNKSGEKGPDPEQIISTNGLSPKETVEKSTAKKTAQDTANKNLNKTSASEPADKKEPKPTAGKNRRKNNLRKETSESKETVNLTPASNAKVAEASKSKQGSGTEKGVSGKPLAGAPPAANLPDKNSNNKTNAQEQNTAAGGGATSSTKPEKPKRPLNMSLGLKAGFETGSANYTARKFVGSAFAEVYFNKKLSFIIQPGVKFAYTNRKTSTSSNSYIRSGNTLNSMNESYADTSGRPTGYYDYTFSQTYDSIVVSTLTKRNFIEIEVPFLFRYRMSKKFSVMGGMNFVFGKTVNVQNSEKNFSKEIFDTVYNVNGIAPAASGKFSHTGSMPYSSYIDSSAQGQINPVRFGYTLGLSYTVREKMMIDLLIQQNMSGTNSIKNQEIRKLFSQPYVRLSLGYVLFGGRKK